ncbi:TetR/AcrR family transcriptional regulator [Nocardia seriolae]|uniref:HTH-type transcriptional regulator n=1 Tax=Nocardia seriolae TaxID=37332 RepID=A0ABC8AW05_9NOCA|nr:helix-turn-helix domain-containing protein [Nocardia seriolae]APA98317.1 putative HTH-type transcriptional regulator [Nocardia seriolae]WKY49750.1 helix-turn-helix domain-containing protein [Nocardia seriolae]WNJ56234.1 helix-turn-helix domain-containing protein [Nocardia seriolae]BEK87822.1 TetR/AcrR family transcriptional regulator [Nocardia seriolae]GEM26131.1 putative TetR-family transcriptional regulator [Nocardia seriolae NBRC 15557]
MADSRDSRQKLVAGAADMIRRRGLNATSVRELAKYARAPLGSTYHYFPGGKTQLAAEAVTFAGELTSTLLTRELENGPVEALRAFLSMWRKVVVDTEFRAGCPVLAVSVEDLPEAEAAPHEAAAAAFSQWTALLTTSLREHGADPAAAERTATLIVAAAEGSVAMCRAEHSTRALDHIGDQLTLIVEDLLARSSSIETPSTGDEDA